MAILNHEDFELPIKLPNLWEGEDADKDFDQLLRELEHLCKLPDVANDACLEDSGPDPWEEEKEEEFDCIYCFKHEVIGEPISNLICPQCLMRATMLGRWESFWFDVEHGPLVL